MAHLLCSRCYTGTPGSYSECSGRGSHLGSRLPPRSSSCGSPRAPWQRWCLCSRPEHDRNPGFNRSRDKGFSSLHIHLIYLPFFKVCKADRVLSWQLRLLRRQRPRVSALRNYRTHLAVHEVEALLCHQNAVSIGLQGRASTQARLPGDPRVCSRGQL